MHNLAANPEYAPVVERMDAALKKWMDASHDIGDPRSMERREK